MIEIIKPLINISLTVFEHLDKDLMMTKGDGSVVTICDFALQSLIMDGIHKAFPGDKVLGEEDVGKVSDDFLSIVRKILPEGFDPVAACKDAIKTIGRDDHRVWVIDPIDGTQGFVGKGHFAIATALLVDLNLKCSITAWPRHSSEFTGLPFDGPAIFAAVEGHGAWAFDLSGNKYQVRVGDHPKEVIAYSNATGGMSRTIKALSEALNIENGIAMISMTKGFILASGNAKVYVKFHLGHNESAWDVAPFELFVREAGGHTSTPENKPIAYTELGEVADSATGLVFTSDTPEYHAHVCQVFRDVLSKR